MKTKILLLILIPLLGLGFAYKIGTNWEIKSGQSSIKIKCNNAKGSISGLKGKIVFDKKNLEGSSIFGSVNANTIEFESKLKTKHAKGEAWLDTKAFPMITYQSNSIIFLKDDIYITQGILNLHGVSKELSFPFKFEEARPVAKFTGTFIINRKEYNINTIGIGEDVTIFLEVPAVRGN